MSCFAARAGRRRPHDGGADGAHGGGGPVTQLLSVSHECACNVDGLFHVTMEFVDEGRRWSDFSATLTDAAGNVAECVFTDDPHAPQTIGVVANGLVGNAAAFAIGCRDAQSGEYITLYEAQVKI